MLKQISIYEKKISSLLTNEINHIQKPFSVEGLARKVREGLDKVREDSGCLGKVMVSYKSLSLSLYKRETTLFPPLYDFPVVRQAKKGLWEPCDKINGIHHRRRISVLILRVGLLIHLGEPALDNFYDPFGLLGR